VIIYLTYNEQPSGIFSSQVVDVVRFLDSELKANIKLISFISIRNFSGNRNIIKHQWPKAMVLPMVPGIKRWKWNSFLLNVICFFLKPAGIIARSVLATNLALGTKVRKVIYDGRGAIAAEWSEYQVINDPTLVKQISELERRAVNDSNFRIAVSEQLIKYWTNNYSYSKHEHVIIPCTLSKVYQDISFEKDEIKKLREEIGFKGTDTVFVYSGSVAGWQSFQMLYQFGVSVLKRSHAHKLLFLSDKDQQIEKLRMEFPDQVVCLKLDQKQVPLYLMTANYGLLIREKSVTNEVASPVKFAEYLACGLKVIISEHLGDYSNLVVKEKIGYVYTPSFDPKPDQGNQNEIRELALKLFTKQSHAEAYKKLIQQLGE
jgi:hypothetical protein